MVQEEFDLIVVGSGPGGASVALDATRQGMKVLILERGEGNPVRGTIWQALRNLGWPGRGLMLTTSGAPVTRGITVGGSSLFYYATAFRPPLEDFRALGVELQPYFEETMQELPIAPLSEKLLGPMAKRIRDSATGLGLPWQELPKFIDQNLCRTGCWRCQYGCPYGAKWNARMFVDQAVDSGAVLRTQTRVYKVDQKKDQIIELEAVAEGRPITLRAAKVVLAAGGIGTAQILQQSGLDEAGKNFFTDPLVAIFGFLPAGSIQEGGREVPMAAGFRDVEAGYVLTDMTLPRPLFQAMALAKGRLHRLGQHDRALTIMVKIRDELSGQINRHGLIRKPLTPADRAKIEAGSVQAGKVLQNAGARGIFRSQVIAAHPGGTAKIGELVDTDLQTRIKGLYVCDCSVIPKPWGLPPTWSLLCLGKRLAAHLGETR